MDETEDRWRGIAAVVNDTEAALGIYRITFAVKRLGQLANPDGSYPQVPREARVTVHRDGDELRVIGYEPPELPAGPITDEEWQARAREAVRGYVGD